ncbi:MAG TPA: diguanylate cyclase [Blastocatellia bacterium]|nr:diguanylate cyclase [Blastocatellia bacterium]
MIKEIVKKDKTEKDECSPDNALTVWLRLQKSLAEKNSIALCTLNQDGAVIGRIENDNSICKALRVSPDHSPSCAADCASAYDNAVDTGQRVEYTCHAGLRCFAIPVTISNKKLVILGGRAFTSTSEYADFLERYEDLDAVATGECLKNIEFLDSRELREAADLVDSTASYHFQGASKMAQSPEIAQASPDLMDAHLEIIRLTDQLESRDRSIAQFYDFLRSVAASLDSQKVYHAVLAKFSEVLKAERSSLMILNEESNELALEAALGAHPESSTSVRIKLGEGIAGSVLASGLPLVVRDVDTDERVPNVRAGHYKSRSFISFPITLGPRKVGVINLTDRKDGLPYEIEDLSLLEMMSPHLALIIDRTEWHKKAETYQQMSLTDPLTGLPNRRYLEDRLFEEVERSKRYDTPLAFMIIDVDHFKSYNDLYGHTNADLVLVKTAHILRNSIRAIDMSARFAGDEFCIVLPETELAAAASIAERLRAAISNTEYHSEKGELMGKVTLSIGVSSFSPTRQSPLSVIETADSALYQAKTRGRDCIAVYEDTTAAG